MTAFPKDPAFIAYATACVVLRANPMCVWCASAAAHAKSKTAANPDR